MSAAQAHDIHIPGKLIYLRSAPEPARGQFVVLSANEEQIFTIPQENCADISEQGTYIVVSSRTGSDLVVYNFHSEAVVMELAWDTRWQMCYFNWIGDGVLSLQDREISTKSYRLDVLTGEIAEYEYVLQTYVPPTYPRLPNWYSGSEIISSPDGNLILYQRCNGEIETYPDRVDCTGISSHFSSTDWIIYDIKHQEAIGMLKNDMDCTPDFLYFLPGGLASFTWDSTSWSPNGRYLAYLKTSGFPLQIYDTIAQQFLDTSFVYVDIDKSPGLQWSPDASKVAFQVIGRLDESRAGDDEHVLRELVIFEVGKPNLDAFQSADIPYNLDGSSNGTWSPDSQSFAFIEANENLIYVEASTGKTSVLDQGVGRIVAWIPETP